MTVLHEVKRPGQTFQVFKGYLKITDRTGCVGVFMPKTISIPLRNIAEVDASPASETLTIKTNDGKTRKYRLGGMGKAASGLRDAIMENM